MKTIKIGFTIICVFILQQASAQTVKFDTLFTLKAKLGITHMDSVFLYYENMQGQNLFQSLPIFNDSFMITDTIRKPMKALILFKNIGETITEKDFESRAKEIYLEAGLLTLTGDPAKLDELKLQGSQSQLELDSLNKLTADVRKEMRPLIALYDKEKDPDKAAQLQAKFEPYENKLKAISYKFFLDFPNSYVTANQMQDFVMQMGLDSSKHVYRAYNNELKASREGMALAAETKKMDDNLPGNMAAGFTAKDMNGNTVSLADHKGKYVLLDFWASWNTTSRKNNPHLLELYHKYNAKGLDIIAIANNDASIEGWKVAVNKDETCIWPNLLSGVGTENDLNDKYAIHFTPTKVLLDPTGKIIGRFGDNYNQDLGMDRLLENIFRKIDEDIKKAKDAETQASIVIK